MAVHNLHTKYSSVLTQVLGSASITENFGNKEYTASLNGNASVIVPTMVVPLGGTYSPDAEDGFRFGALKNVTDTIQEIKLTEELSGSPTIEARYNTQQQKMMRAIDIIQEVVYGQYNPARDSFALKTWAEKAGTYLEAATAPDETDVFDYVFDAKAKVNGRLPLSGLTLFANDSTFKAIKKAAIVVQDIGGEAFQGRAFNIDGLKVVWMPEFTQQSGLYFVMVHEKSAVSASLPQMIRTNDAYPGVNGTVVEYVLRFGADVISALNIGVVACVAPANKVEDTTITLTDSHYAIATDTSAATIKYTLDGTDPRTSSTASTYSAPIDPPSSGTIIKAAASKTGLFNSNITSLTV